MARGASSVHEVPRGLATSEAAVVALQELRRQETKGVRANGKHCSPIASTSGRFKLRAKLAQGKGVYVVAQMSVAVPC